MTAREDRQAETIERLADHVLAHWLEGSSLKALAASAGTSDRMLIYYFETKDGLLAAVLARIAGRMTEMLEGGAPADFRLPREALIATVWPLLSGEAMRPYMRVWLELIAASARDVEPHRTISNGILGGFLAWIAQHLEVEGDPRAEAALALATLDGLMLLEAAGHADAAGLAVSALGGRPS